MRTHLLFLALSLAACSEYELAPEKDSEVGADDELDAPQLDSDPEDSIEDGDTGEDFDTEPNNEEEPPPAEAPVYAHSADTLYEVDPDTGARIFLGTFTLNGAAIEESFIDIAIDLNGNMFGATFTALYQINPTNADIKHICDVDVDMIAMTFSSDDELFAGGSDGIHIINVVNCRTTPLSVGGGYQTSGDLVGLPDGYLYWTVRGNRDELVRVDPLTGASEWIGSIGYSEIYGLGYDDGTLYGFNSFGETLAINPNTGDANVLTSDGTISWYGATTNPVQW